MYTAHVSRWSFVVLGDINFYPCASLLPEISQAKVRGSSFWVVAVQACYTSIFCKYCRLYLLAIQDQKYNGSKSFPIKSFYPRSINNLWLDSRVVLRISWRKFDYIQWRIQDFPWGGRGPRRGGRGLLSRLRFKNFVCQNKRIWTLRGACAGHLPM